MDPGLPLLFFLAICGCCCGKTAPKQPRAPSTNVWPTKGFNLCNAIKHKDTKMDCIKCFQVASSNPAKASKCVEEWLPPKLAACSKWMNGNGNADAQQKFLLCLRRAEWRQGQEMNRAERYYAIGGKHLTEIGNSTILEDGGAAMFSCMSQELLLTDLYLQDHLHKSSSDCLNRFQMDDINQKWHLEKDDRPSWWWSSPSNNKPGNKSMKGKSRKASSTNHLEERTLVYEYGALGNSMPFHGIGPFAVDILKGECLFKSMKDDVLLDDLVQTIFDSGYPVPSWIFREILNNIGSINLPLP